MKTKEKDEELNLDEIAEAAKKLPMNTQLLALGGGKKADGDWLSNLPDGSIFLAQFKSPQAPKHMLPEFKIVGKLWDEKKAKAAVKITQFADSQEATLFVDPTEFCKLYDLYILVRTGEE
jgi:hypothetical protein